MSLFIRIILLLIASIVQANPSSPQPSPQIVVSIRPLYGITQTLLEGITAPQLLLQESFSPHHFHMLPSQAQMLIDADLIIYIDPQFERFLDPFKEKFSAKSLILSNAAGISLKPSRNHHHDDHHHNDHHHTSHAPSDFHIWLSLHNMKSASLAIKNRLIPLFPNHQSLIERNFKTLTSQFSALEKSFQSTSVIRYIAHHDALQYLEPTLNLKLLGIITPEAELNASGKHLHQLEKQITEEKPHCILAETNLDTRVVHLLAEKWRTQAVTVDLLGFDLPLSSNHYFEMMRHIKHQLDQCNIPKK